MSRRKSRAKSSSLTSSNRGGVEPSSLQDEGGGVGKYLLGRLREEQGEARENGRIWRAFHEAPGWLTAALLVLATAIQLLVAADGNLDVAIAIASSMDTSRIFLIAAIAGITSLGGLIPFYFFIYFRHELALRYRDIALAKAVGDKLYDESVLNYRIRGVLQWLLILVALTLLYVPAWLSVLVLVLLLFGGVGAIRSPFAPWNFWDRLEAQGHLKLPREQLSEVIKTKVEVSNLRRMNGAFVVVLLITVAFIVTVPGAMLPRQDIRLKDNANEVGSVLGSTSTGIAILTDKPRRVVIVNPAEIDSVQYCTERSERISPFGDRTLLDIVQGDRPWSAPACGGLTKGVGNR